ncbi:aminotransferase class V-fold PLP-dependent enzyme [bacterium]|nr:aminotransferase class V-fold PLP-dependent enzyme [bacterium]
MSIYRQFGIEPIINAAGTLTRLGGAVMPDAVIEAMKLAAQSTVLIEELQAAGSRVLARLTQTEAGLITAGASAGLTLGAAAILAGNNVERINRLPETEGFANEFLIAIDQRNGYDHAVRAAGARLVNIGMNEKVAGSGVRGVERADYAMGLSERTAGVLYVYRDGASPTLREVVAWAHEHRLPVMVDAAAELSRRAHLHEIPSTGADLIAFSGGKAIRGPQSTGILCGKRDLIESAAMQMLDLDLDRRDWSPPTDLIDPDRWPAIPRHGIGRSLKVAKEQMVGLLVAAELFAQGIDPATRQTLDQRRARMVDLLRRKSLSATVGSDDGDEPGPILIPVDSPSQAATIVRSLRAGRPAVYARCNEARTHLALNLSCVRAEQENVLIDRVKDAYSALDSEESRE